MMKYIVIELIAAIAAFDVIVDASVKELVNEGARAAFGELNEK